MVEPCQEPKNFTPTPHDKTFSTLSGIIRALMFPMSKRKICHIIFTLESYHEIDPYNEPRVVEAVGLLRGFEHVMVELRKRPWALGRPSCRFAVEDEDEDVTVGVEELNELLTGGPGVGSVPKVKIIRSFADGSRGVEVLYDSEDVVEPEHEERGDDGMGVQ